MLQSTLTLAPQNRDGMASLLDGCLVPFLHGRRVVFAANTAWYLYNYHRNTIASFLRAGCQVVVLTPEDDHSRKLAALGCRTEFLPLRGASKNPVREARAAAAFFRIYRRLRPHLAFHFTIKCNLYGGLAAGRLGIPHVNNICGLGSAFDREGVFNRLAQAAYRFTHRRTDQVFFQNPDDFDFMRDRGLVSEAQALLLPGSGVDLDHFRPAGGDRAVNADGADENAPVFVFAGRMLREKGLAQLAGAMRLVRAQCPGATCRVYGFLEPRDPRYVSPEELALWQAEGLLQYRGPLDDVRPAYAAADCVVLPTYYREGVPKSLLEAAAMGKPLVATSLTGCRAALQDGVNGFLCEPRDVGSLAAALMRMIEAGPEGRARMGRQGRARVEAAFSEERVTRAYLDAARTFASSAA
jgi:glycosyltransferase involved in cell wall biosynthesis